MARHNKSEFKRVFNAWLKILRLTHWEIYFQWDDDPENDLALASVQVESDYDIAHVRLADGWRDWDTHTLNRVIVHELLHLHFRDYDDVLDTAIAPSAYDSRELLRKMAHHELEGLIDRLAHCFVDAHGYA